MAFPGPNPNNPITDGDQKMSQAFRTWTIRVTELFPLIGHGSPEGAVEAPLYSLYIDADGTTGAIEYRKMQTDIAGDKKQGWVLL